MKITYHDVWQIEFSVGPNLNNIVEKFHLLGEPTLEKITAYLENKIRVCHSQVWFDSGLPNVRILECHQCLANLKHYGMPELGLAKQYTMMDWKDRQRAIGHLSIIKIDNIITVG